MNPASIMKLMSAKNKFQKNHPKFVAFLNRCFAGGLKAVSYTHLYDGKVQVVNNQRISVTMRQSVLDAKELAKRGKSAAEIKEILEKHKMESSIYICLLYTSIPCIAWGRNARFAGGLEVGAHLQVSGRVQSREYTKKIGEEEVERRVAYEVSVSKIDLVEDEE